MRPFPFDQETVNFYDTEEWRCRTGIGQLAQTLFRKAEDLFLMLAFYGDGSGEHGVGPFVVAGYMANTLDWFQIERDWDQAIKAAPSINYFKAREAVCKRLKGGRMDFTGQFAGWNPRDVEAKCLCLADVIVKHRRRMVAIASVLRWDDYHSVIGDDACKKVFYTPYLICINGIFNEALKRSTEQFKEHPGRLAFVFDTEGEQPSGDTQRRPMMDT